MKLVNSLLSFVDLAVIPVVGVVFVLVEYDLDA